MSNQNKIAKQYWTLVIYLDNRPDNWIDIINETRPQWACSPLHDQDVNPDGTIKKAHTHILIKYSGRKSYQEVLKLSKRLKAPNPQPCDSPVGMARYFIHRDNPEKYQYNPSDIYPFNGFDIKSMLEPDKKETTAILREIYQYILDNTVTESWELTHYAFTQKPAWETVITKKAYVINKFIDSFRHSESGQMYARETAMEKQRDPEQSKDRQTTKPNQSKTDNTKSKQSKVDNSKLNYQIKENTSKFRDLYFMQFSLKEYLDSSESSL